MTGFDWAAFWPQILAVLLDKPLGVLVIIVVAVLARLVMIVVIRRVVDRVVSGVKRRQGVEDTQMLQSSPLAAVRSCSARARSARCSATW